MSSAVWAPNTGKLYVFGGGDALGTVVNTTRIYDPGTNTWSVGTPMPDVRAFMASGYYNGKIYLVGGYSTGNVSPAYGQVWEYDPVPQAHSTPHELTCQPYWVEQGSASSTGTCM